MPALNVQEITKMETTDIQLIDRCRRGDQQAFSELYQRYRSRLFAYILKIIPGNKSMAEDIFQQVWMKAASSLDKYNDQEKFIAWLYRIGHNLTIDHFRRSSARGGFHVELNEEIDTFSVHVASVDYDEEAKYKALDDAISQLPDEQKAILEMRKEGLSFKEISDKLGINLNTALGRMHLAINKLKITMQSYL